MHFYVLDSGGDLIGPLTADEVQAKIESGRLSPGDRFRPKGGESWRPISEFSMTTAPVPSSPKVERVKCPACSEPIMPDASICPFCKTNILSKDKSTNAAANLILYAVVFVALYFTISQFTSCQAKREIDRMEREAK